ncbi:hypothetical protein [Maricaulis sp.]|uniref:hypothetical protein n=1 Tax=Maricaulis sp. TaxID=1486257 RepID=UPI003297B660
MSRRLNEETSDRAAVAFVAVMAYEAVSHDAMAWVDRDPDLPWSSENMEAARRLLDFGRRHSFPPAETFARQAPDLGGPAFSAERWRCDVLYRASWEAFRGVLVALSPLKLGFDPVPEPPTRPRLPRDPDDDGFEQDAAGAFERETFRGPRAKCSIPTNIKPQRKGAGTPLSQVKGIGDAIEKRLMAAGVGNAEQLAMMNDVDLDALADRDPGLPDLLRKRPFGGLRASPIEAARQLVNDASPG